MNNDSGFTMIEVLVAMFLSLVVVGAAAAALVSNDDSALGTQRQSQLVAALQARVELVHQLVTQYGFSALALGANPLAAVDATLPSNPNDPNDFITSYASGFNTSTSATPENFLIEKNYNSTGEGTVDGGTTFAEELEVDTTNGKIAPVTYFDLSNGTSYASQGSVPSGDTYATVHTYVTLTSVGTNSSSPPTCPAGSAGSTVGDARRVVVAAVLSAVSGHANTGSTHPVYTTTLFGNPIPNNACQSASGLRLGFNIG
ncbi:MAG: PulJ/GspJ family protein [Solirubrobacteraceae bacterium]